MRKENVVIIKLSNYEHALNHLTAAVTMLHDWTGWLTDGLVANGKYSLTASFKGGYRGNCMF